MGRFESAWQAMLGMRGWWMPAALRRRDLSQASDAAEQQQQQDEEPLATVTIVEIDQAPTFCPACLAVKVSEADGLRDRQYVVTGKPRYCADHALATLRHYALPRPPDFARWERRFREERQEQHTQDERREETSDPC